MKLYSNYIRLFSFILDDPLTDWVFLVTAVHDDIDASF